MTLVSKNLSSQLQTPLQPDFVTTYIETFHIFMIVFLEVPRQLGENGIICDPWPLMNI